MTNMKLVCFTLLFLVANPQNVLCRVVVEVVRSEGSQLAERDLESEDLSKRKSVPDGFLWPSADVPYDFAADVSQSLGNKIEVAMEDWMKYTCLTFRRKTASDTDYIFFKTIDGGCYSDSIGINGGEQQINIQGNVNGSGCEFNHIILHEIGHAIGLYHEQSRLDRDDHVTIHWENIKEGKEHNFNKAVEGQIDMRGVPYDYYSIMHYKQDDFSTNGNLTITTTDRYYQDIIGTTERLSLLDIDLVNKAYSCPITYFRIRNQVNSDVLDVIRLKKVIRAAENQIDTQYWFLDGKYIRNKAAPSKVLAAEKKGAQTLGEGRLFLRNQNCSDNQLWEVIKSKTQYGIQSDFLQKSLVIGAKLKADGVTVTNATYALTPTKGEDLQNWDFETIPV